MADVVDYTALAAKHGGKPVKPASSGTDYAALAAKHGGKAASNQSGPNVTSTVSQAPSPYSWEGIKHEGRYMLEKGLEWTPAIAGTVGGIVTGAAASPTGPGAIPAAVGGAALFGGAGEAASQLIRRGMGWEAPKTSGEAAAKIGKEAAIQGTSELIGQGIGAAFRPTLFRTIAKLHYASGLGPASMKPMEKGSLETVINDLTQAAEKSGKAPKTVGEFLNLVTKTEQDVNTEVGIAMRQPVKIGDKVIPLSGVEMNTNSIAERVKALAESHVSEIELNPKRAATFKAEALIYEKPRNFAWLNDRRIVLNNHLKGFYSLPAAERVHYLFEHPEMEAWKAEADAIRDTLYPEMDRVSGKPAGYFEALQQRHGALMDVKAGLEKNIKKLKSDTMTRIGAPFAEKFNITTYGTSSGKPGLSIHKLGQMVTGATPMKEANAKVASAFGATAGSKVAKAVSSKAGMEVMALPLRYLGVDTPEGDETDNGQK